MATNGINIIFGGGIWLSGDVDEINKWIPVLEESGIKTLDTAKIYGKSEEGLGNAGAASRFIIDTKFPGGFGQDPATRENVIATGQESLDKLKTDSVDVYYVHAPDRKTPLKETLDGLNELYKKGAFRRLGLSNFSAEEVEEALRIAEENNFVKPSVYQGNYSAIARRTETEVFPVLRKNKITFNAYSPIGGGFLSKSKETLTEAGGRFDPQHAFGALYNGLYNKPSFVAVLDEWAQIAENEKVSRAEVAYRWIVYHSHLDPKLGDGVIVGARNTDQLKETVEGIRRGPLSKDSVERIEKIWDSIKDDSPLDNFEFSQSRL